MIEKRNGGSKGYGRQLEVVERLQLARLGLEPIQHALASMAEL